MRAPHQANQTGRGGITEGVGGGRGGPGQQLRPEDRAQGQGRQGGGLQLGGGPRGLAGRPAGLLTALRAPPSGLGRCGAGCAPDGGDPESQSVALGTGEGVGLRTLLWGPGDQQLPALHPKGPFPSAGAQPLSFSPNPPQFTHSRRVIFIAITWPCSQVRLEGQR